jgi:uncharacterized protein (TIGR04255 family)
LATFLATFSTLLLSFTESVPTAFHANFENILSLPLVLTRDNLGQSDAALIGRKHQAKYNVADSRALLMQYPHAPIVEAILELRFAKLVELDRAVKAADKFSEEFPISEDQASHQFLIGPSGEPTRVEDWKGRKRSNLDATDIVRISTAAFTTMRLAPYGGWDQLFDRTQRQWSIVKKTLGKPVISRIGCRYINRIDIAGIGKINVDDYLAFAPLVPDALKLVLGSYFMQANVPCEGDNFGVALHSGSADSPLVAHSSFVLDIDIFRDGMSVTDDDGLWSVLQKMRDYKNVLFEGCITDKARDLFK